MNSVACGWWHCGLFQIEVMEIALDKIGTAVERRLAYIDKNRDLYMTPVRVYGSARKTVKLGMLQLK